ncbi:hypothetical protein L208DRAFT_1483117 [Tricholoma matsutake]|nr:hypothetical protein L208DRAFT_1483117 [Tricholoma matsutake 945]
MIVSHVRAWQPTQESWMQEHLMHEQAITLGQAIDISTWKNYGLALNSYLTLVCMHNMPVEPTANTLSLFTIYMSHHIKPNSVDTYLSGICQQLEPYFPHIREARKSHLVHRTLQGFKRLRGLPTTRKQALTIDDLNLVCINYSKNPSHDDLLFCTQLCTGFFALMRLGELTWPDDNNLRDPQKLSKRNSVIINEHFFQFFLPGHKADKFFDGNIIMLQPNPFPCNPMALFSTYLQSCDCLCPWSSLLWLKENGKVPTRSFFMRHLRLFFKKDIGRQSMRAGGAMSLAENGVAPHIIQGIG